MITYYFFIILFLSFKKELKLPNCHRECFSFTQSLENWNESNTLKYSINDTEKPISIGEFQVHKNRSCFKFRFNIKNILKILEPLN